MYNVNIYLPGVLPHPSRPPAQKSIKKESVQDMGKTVRIKEVLGHPVKKNYDISLMFIKTHLHMYCTVILYIHCTEPVQQISCTVPPV